MEDKRFYESDVQFVVNLPDHPRAEAADFTLLKSYGRITNEDSVIDVSIQSFDYGTEEYAMISKFYGNKSSKLSVRLRDTLHLAHILMWIADEVDGKDGFPDKVEITSNLPEELENHLDNFHPNEVEMLDEMMRRAFASKEFNVKLRRLLTTILFRISVAEDEDFVKENPKAFNALHDPIQI